MGKYIKSYHLFVSSPLARIGLYVLYPVFLFLINAVMTYFSSNFIFSLAITMILMCAIELVADHDIYGGIANRDTNKLEYLKTSCNGMNLLFCSVIVDAIRRFLSISIIVTLLYSQHVSVVALFTIIFSMLFLIELGLIICRLTYMIQIAFAITSLLQLFIIWLTVLIALNLLPIWAPILCLILWLSITCLGRYIIMKTARKSYYDK